MRCGTVSRPCHAGPKVSWSRAEGRRPAVAGLCGVGRPAHNRVATVPGQAAVPERHGGRSPIGRCNESANSIDYLLAEQPFDQGPSMTDWSQIVAEHGVLVWRTARRLLTQEADAADCFQRTFLAAVELAQRETVRHWPALLRRLATARALEQLRERLRYRQRFADVGIDREVDQEAIGPDSAAVASELADDLRVALSEIDQPQAQVFCLACLDECSYAEVGEQLGITANNVGVILNRAKAALRKRLESHNPASDLRETKREVGQ